MSAAPPIARPMPELEGELAPFIAAAKEHRLMVQRCTGCGALRFPPREICSRCLSSSAEWTNVSGRGEIFSFNVMHQVYHPAFAREVPYAVIVVKLAEGPKITSNLLDCPIDRINIGMPVEVVFEQISDAVTLPKFRVRAQS
ncbi:MAG: hypothetical protein B6D46_06620 [Polyangiaceae bacterium UTPRO1]|nr:MAG: hypothetical protein B6D46_06620 [Polyangiaceae bacterium UTPRO1]